MSQPTCNCGRLRVRIAHDIQCKCAAGLKSFVRCLCFFVAARLAVTHLSPAGDYLDLLIKMIAYVGFSVSIERRARATC
jgi:hypothetical protein